MDIIKSLSSNALNSMVQRAKSDIKSGAATKQVNLMEYLTPLTPSTVQTILDEENTPLNVLLSLKAEYQHSIVKLALAPAVPDPTYSEIRSLTEEPEMLLSDFYSVIYFHILIGLYNKHYIKFVNENFDQINSELENAGENSEHLQHLVRKFSAAMDLVTDDIGTLANNANKIPVASFDKAFQSLNKVDEFKTDIEKLRFLISE